MWAIALVLLGLILWVAWSIYNTVDNMSRALLRLAQASIQATPPPNESMALFDLEARVQELEERLDDRDDSMSDL